MIPIIPPYENVDLVPRPDLPDYQVEPQCACPRCDRVPDDPHHIASAGQLGIRTAWVIVDGLLIGNLAGLCREHHDQVTGEIGGHKAAIRWDVETKRLYWLDLGEKWADALDPMPPIHQPQTEGSSRETVAGAQTATETMQTEAARSLESTPVSAPTSPEEPHTTIQPWQEDAVGAAQRQDREERIDERVREVVAEEGFDLAATLERLGGTARPAPLETGREQHTEEITDHRNEHGDLPIGDYGPSLVPGGPYHEPVYPEPIPESGPADPKTIEELAAFRHDELFVAAGEPCPTCKRRVPKPATKQTLDPDHPHKDKRTWSLSVPKEEREDGYALIEDNLRQAAEAMGIETSGSSWKYRALVDATGWFLLHYDTEGED